MIFVEIFSVKNLIYFYFSPSPLFVKLQSVVAELYKQRRIFTQYFTKTREIFYKTAQFQHNFIKLIFIDQYFSYIRIFAEIVNAIKNTIKILAIIIVTVNRINQQHDFKRRKK